MKEIEKFDINIDNYINWLKTYKNEEIGNYFIPTIEEWKKIEESRESNRLYFINKLETIALNENFTLKVYLEMQEDLMSLTPEYLEQYRANEPIIHYYSIDDYEFTRKALLNTFIKEISQIYALNILSKKIDTLKEKNKCTY